MYCSRWKRSPIQKRAGRGGLLPLRKAVQSDGAMGCLRVSFVLAQQTGGHSIPGGSALSEVQLGER
jgi:hypothetical protein